MADVIVLALAVMGAGLVAAWVTARRQRADAEALVERLRGELEQQRDRSVQAAVDTLVTVAREQLGSQTEAGVAAFDSRNELMDQRIDGMHHELQRITSLVREFEADRADKLGALRQQLDRTGQTTAELARATSTLREALASSSSRGQWGERMAEDVLRTAGLVEGINYERQRTTASGSRPDFTFLLPDDRVLHMDVKFPLDNYLRVLECDGDDAADPHHKAFLRDVRARIKELAGRGYIDPANGTLDYVLLFIPNEHVYAYVHQHDRELLDLALDQRVVLCSPLTLFAVLSVIRQAVDAFALEARSGEILDLLAAFRDQWDRFTGAMDKLGDRIDATRRDYDKLVTTRRRQLERQLDRVEALRDDEPEPARLAAVPTDEVGTA